MLTAGRPGMGLGYSLCGYNERMDASEQASKDMTPQERALESGKDFQNQPWAAFQG